MNPFSSVLHQIEWFEAFLWALPSNPSDKAIQNNMKERKKELDINLSLDDTQLSFYLHDTKFNYMEISQPIEMNTQI